MRGVARVLSMADGPDEKSWLGKLVGTVADGASKAVDATKVSHSPH